MGGKKTSEKTQQNFYWFKMKEDINSYVSSCDTCANSKKPNKMPRAHLGSLEVGAQMDRLNTDFVGQLLKTPRGNRYILAVSDQFSKWAKFYPYPIKPLEYAQNRFSTRSYVNWVAHYPYTATKAAHTRVICLRS